MTTLVIIISCFVQKKTASSSFSIFFEKFNVFDCQFKVSLRNVVNFFYMTIKFNILYLYISFFLLERERERERERGISILNIVAPKKGALFDNMQKALLDSQQTIQQSFSFFANYRYLTIYRANKKDSNILNIKKYYVYKQINYRLLKKRKWKKTNYQKCTCLLLCQ